MYFVVRLPIDVATSVVNIQRENDGEGTVCARTVDRFVDRSPSLLRQPRPSLKSGSADPASNWAKARLNQMIQLKGQLILPGLSCCDGRASRSIITFFMTPCHSGGNQCPKPILPRRDSNFDSCGIST